MCIAVSAFASPSISNLHDRKEIIISPESTDGTNTASFLSRVEIYTNEAISDQYKMKDENGNLVPTNISNMIDAAASTVTASDENGKSIVESIPAVTDILANISEYTAEKYEEKYGFNPEKLDQLTYMMDFKYTATDYRVIAGEKIFFFKMKEYDEKTGNYVADFPCVGPYMITQVMNR